MTPTELVLLIIEIEGVALAITLATIFGYALWSRAARESRAKRLATGRAIIASRLEAKTIRPDQMQQLRFLPQGDQVRLFFEIAPSVGEVERAWLRGVAAQLGVLQHATDLSRASQWWDRLSGARMLTFLDASTDVMLPLFRDADPMVRSQAANYVSQHPTHAGIEAVIRLLADKDALCRYAAKDALMRLGAAAAPAVISRLRNPHDPQMLPLLEVACATATHAYMPAAEAHLDDRRADVRLLVTRLLRGIGGPAAAEYLMKLAADPDAKVRESAVEALGYLNHWVASPIVAALLDDPVSRVRLAAALALNQLGPTGELLLRRAKTRGSERAQAAASRILDDPSRRTAAPTP
jgi:HEAT repeat protein